MGLFVFEPFRSDPPSPAVTAGNTKILTTQGSYCWSGFLSTKCVDKVYTSPLDMAKEHQPTAVSPSEVIQIDFRNNPIAKNVKVEQWKDEKRVTKMNMKNNAIVAPKEKGVYVYYMKAKWHNGDGSYAFSVMVQ